MSSIIDELNNDRLKEVGNSPVSEMTLREYIATQSMVAIINKEYGNGKEHAIRRAIDYADELIKQLHSK